MTKIENMQYGTKNHVMRHEREVACVLGNSKMVHVKPVATSVT